MGFEVGKETGMSIALGGKGKQRGKVKGREKEEDDKSEHSFAFLALKS